MASLALISSSKCFGGQQRIYSFMSTELKSSTRFGIYIPEEYESANDSAKFPVIFYLSGLSCTEENFIQKSGFQRFAAKHGIIVVNPDTSPRGCNIEGENDNWDFGLGAGFYLDATEEKWAKNYRMYSYVCKELPALICREFKVDSTKFGIMGHSMGGHGALIFALKNPSVFRSVSAFAPITNPTQCPWGIKAFKGYLGENNRSNWLSYDSCHLAEHYEGPKVEILIDQGDEDKFYKEKQLLPENFANICSKSSSKIGCNIRYQKGYDHSYFFISTFIGDHFDHHVKILKR